MEILCKEQEKKFENGEKFQSLGEAMKDPVRLGELKQEFNKIMMDKHLNISDKMQIRRSYIGDGLKHGPHPNIVRQIEEWNEILDEQRKEKEQQKAIKEQREIDNNKYLKNISDNTDYIVKQFKDTALNLERLNNLLGRANMTLEDIRNDVNESKLVDFEVFELLAKNSIATEPERLEATEKLLTKLKDKAYLIDVSANIMTLFDIVLNSMN